MTPYPHQTTNARDLFLAVQAHGCALDVSDTGTGKSLTALIVAAALERNPFVICPLSVGPGWEAKFAAVGVEGGWLNYEKARKPGWTPPPNSLVIFDEAHRCKSPSSKQAELLMRVSATHSTLLLSATPFASPLDTRAVMHATRVCNWNNWYSLLPRLGCRRVKHLHNSWQWNGQAATLDTMRAMLAPLMVKTRWADVPGFPDLIIQPEAVPVADPKAVDAALRTIAASHKLDLVKTLEARMLVESAKVLAMIDLALDLEAQGNSVVAFFNFTAPLRAFAADVGAAIIDGSTPGSERGQIVSQFQSSLTPRFLACNIRAGGEGIDLHDTVGVPRVALHCPTWSAQDAKQAFGRIHRVGAKSRAVQKIIFAAKTLDERVLRVMQTKANNIATLTDQDLTPEI